MAGTAGGGAAEPLLIPEAVPVRMLLISRTEKAVALSETEIRIRDMQFKSCPREEGSEILFYLVLLNGNLGAYR